MFGNEKKWQRRYKTTIKVNNFFSDLFIVNIPVKAYKWFMKSELLLPLFPETKE